MPPGSIGASNQGLMQGEADMKIDTQPAMKATWAKQAQQMRDKAQQMPEGVGRDALIKRAHGLETASQVVAKVPFP